MKVREVLQLLRTDGRVLIRTRGSHRQLKHPAKRGTVTVAGKPGVDIPPGTQQYSETGWAKIVDMKYLVIIEKSDSGFGAYVPDLPGCVAAGETREEVRSLIQEAIEFHIEGLKQGGDPVPLPTSHGEWIDIHAA